LNHRRGNYAFPGLSLAIGVYLVLAVAYGVVAPPLESPDEIGHFFATKYMADHGALPEPDKPWAQQYFYGQEGSQPPLYYWVGALILRLSGVHTGDAWNYKQVNPHTTCGSPLATGNKAFLAHDPSFPWRDSTLAIHLLRLYSTALGLATVIGVAAIARLCFPGRLWVALLCVALTALNPQFLFVSAGVNNDNMVVALCTWGVYWILRASLHGFTPATTVLIGLLIGLAALSKLTGLLLAPLAGLAISFAAWRQRRARPPLALGSFAASRLALVGLPVLAVFGWWCLRNALLYADPLLIAHHLAIVKSHPPLPLMYMGYDIPDLFRSYWGRFTCDLVPGDWYSALWGLVVLAGFMGLVLRGRKRLSWRQQVCLLGLTAWFMLVFLGWLRWNMITTGVQGRLLFPATASVSVLVGGGWSWWVDRRRWLEKVLLLAWLGLALWVLLGLLVPAFAPPRRYADAAALDIPNRVDGVFGERIALLGFDVQPTSLEPGQTVEVTLYLSATRPMTELHSMGLWFVSAVPGETSRLTGLDTWPGHGNYPTTAWNPGEVVVDRYRLRVPREVERAQAWVLQVSFYGVGEGKRLPLSQNGQVVGDRALLGWIRVGTGMGRLSLAGTPVAPSLGGGLAGSHEAPTAGGGVVTAGPGAVFGGAIALRGARAVPGEEALRVTLWWEAQAPLSGNYAVFVHLLDEDGRLVGTGDGPPLGGGFPTQMWHPGDSVVDEHVVPLPPNLATGGTSLHVGWYDPVTGARLSVGSGDYFDLGKQDLTARSALSGGSGQRP